MTRIRFEDLPSTNTPRNAENLNKLNNVVISPTMPSTGEEVWLQKGKNLFDGSFFGNYILDNSTGELSVDARRITSNYIKISENTNYVISSSNTSLYVYIRYFTENKSYISGTSWMNISNATFETPSDTKFIVLCFKLEEAGTKLISLSDITNSQVEQGETATPYEPYIDKKIHTKNDNGGYEEFYDETNLENYSLGEQRIGTWIDGKPLYRKVIYANSIDCTVEGFKYVAHGISNLKQAPKLTYAIEHDGHMETYNNVINALSATPENIRLYVKAWGVIKNWYFTIEYTKTTD